ncbi:MAG TPA: hypothetical protein VFV54_07540 [Thermoanaerobaculia bacterium]|nr:hypothetical protein [Thermoanaerobaculia bacterium]
MPAIQFPSLADRVRTLPPEGAIRDRQLHRLIDTYAASEAAAALQAAAVRARTEGGVLALAIASADGILAGGRADRAHSPDDVPERDCLRDAVVSPAFLALLPGLIRELREVASIRPGSGACTVASALELWAWTMKHFRAGEGARGGAVAQATDELAEILCPLLAARSFALEVGAASPQNDPAELELRSDLSHIHAARAAASAGAACAELVFGYRRHLGWDEEGCATCYDEDELDRFEALIPGIAAGARSASDVIEADGSHPAKRGPCARFEGVSGFMRLRNRLDGCLTGVRFARDRAAAALARSTAATMVEGRG